MQSKIQKVLTRKFSVRFVIKIDKKCSKCPMLKIFTDVFYKDNRLQDISFI